MEMPTALFARRLGEREVPYIYLLYRQDLRLLLQDPGSGRAVTKWKDDHDEWHHQSFKNSQAYKGFTPWRHLAGKLDSGVVDSYTLGKTVVFLKWSVPETPGPEPSAPVLSRLVFHPDDNGKVDAEEKYTELTDALAKQQFAPTGACPVSSSDYLFLTGKKNGKPHWCVWNTHQHSMASAPSALPPEMKGEPGPVLSGHQRAQQGKAEPKVLLVYVGGGEYPCTVTKDADAWKLAAFAKKAEDGFLPIAGPRR
ncbi:hypothetical protein [Streptomyces buecherae]|uniref:hypothetical protein n=1 Tax=Streptomyces buecherae TaxID=2763006 RepID=UPI00379C4EBF